MTIPITRRDPDPANAGPAQATRGTSASRVARASGMLRATAVAVALAIAVAACSPFSRSAAVRETYLLQPPLPAASAATPRAGSLGVGTVRVAAPYRGREFVFRTGALRFESNYYFQFLVDPAAMVTDGTVRALEAAQPFAEVVGPGSGLDADWRLDGFVSALYADVRDPAQPAAELDVTWYLTPAEGGARTPVWTREYRQRTPMRDATPQAYVAALNAGFGAMVSGLAGDLAQAKLPAR